MKTIWTGLPTKQHDTSKPFRNELDLSTPQNPCPLSPKNPPFQSPPPLQPTSQNPCPQPLKSNPQHPSRTSEAVHPQNEHRRTPQNRTPRDPRKKAARTENRPSLANPDLSTSMPHSHRRLRARVNFPSDPMTV
ncbi:hypothetical protein MFRU_003g00480 [Monilinia fructicola]|nr:hypothetical protein MFRU_003g00480 [Monilinia fructicola]